MTSHIIYILKLSKSSKKIFATTDDNLCEMHFFFINLWWRHSELQITQKENAIFIAQENVHYS